MIKNNFENIWNFIIESKISLADWIIYLQGNHLICSAIIIFFIGAFGIFTARKNIITILLSIELLLLSVNINFVGFSIIRDDLFPQIWVIYVLTLAGAEAAIGLAILILFYRIRGVISVSSAISLKG
jgi:NADH-quinone oxidoreductase subunit K